MVDNSSCGEQRTGSLCGAVRGTANISPDVSCCCVAAFPGTSSYWREEEERRELDKNRSIWMEM